MNRQAIRKFLQDIPEQHLDELTEAIFYVSQTFPFSHPLQAAILEANKTTRQRIDDEIQAKKDKGEIA